ncbi:MAG: PTS sugar transporter subunit IIA [Desulfosarcina sp.]|nr:PTS sugar transporter subunit IIA [Desulfobacterales bacterium]
MKLTIEQIACALDLPRRKIERWIRQGRIPLSRRGDACTFDRQGLEDWARQHHLRFCIGSERPIASCLPPAESLLAALKHGGIHYGIEGQGVSEVIQAAVECLTVVAPETKSDLVAKLIERENLTSTGLGNHIAVPHPREPDSLSITSPSLSACYLKEPVDFKALDGRPVNLLFVLLAPSVRTHLQLLSRLSYCLRDNAFITFLHRCPQPDDLLKEFSDLEVKWERAALPSG